MLFLHHTNPRLLQSAPTGDALELLRWMPAVGLKPNKVKYDALNQGLCAARRIDSVEGIVEPGDIDGKNLIFKPDTCSSNTLIIAYLKWAAQALLVRC